MIGRVDCSTVIPRNIIVDLFQRAESKPVIDRQTSNIMIQYSHTKADLTQQHTTIDWESRLQHRDLTAKPQAS